MNDPRGRSHQTMPPAASKQWLSRTLAYVAQADGTIEVFDLDFAAYLLMRDLPIADMVEEGPKRNGQPPRYRFVFQASKDQVQELSVDYTNSESARFADCVRRVKKAIRSTCPREA